MWQEYPKDLEVLTPLGVLYLAVTDATHVYVSTEPSSYSHPKNGHKNKLTYRNREYGVSFHLTHTSNGWELYSAGSTDMWPMGFTAIPSGLNKEIKTKCIPLIGAFLSDANSARILRNAQEAHVNNECERRHDEVNKLKEQIAVLENECSKLKESLQ